MNRNKRPYVEYNYTALSSNCDTKIYFSRIKMTLNPSGATISLFHLHFTNKRFLTNNFFFIFETVFLAIQTTFL